MGKINVPGLGVVNIEGDAPSPDEEAVIMEALQQQEEEDAYAPIPAVIPGPDIEQAREAMPPTVEGVTEEAFGMPVNRDAFTMGGAMIGETAGTGGGGVLGSVAGPIGTAAGMGVGNRVGGVLGAGAGSLVYDSLDALIKSSRGYKPPPGTESDPLGPTKQAGKEMMYEAGGQSAAKMLDPLLKGAKSTGRWLMGVNRAAEKELANLSSAYSVPLGIVEATRRDWLKGSTRVLGVIPWVGGSFKKQAGETASNITRLYDDLVDSFAPSATMAEMGVKFTDAARKRFSNFSNTSGLLYDKFYKLSNALPDSQKSFISTANMREAAQTLIRQAEEGAVMLKTGEPERDLLINNLREFTKDLAKYPNTINATQFRAKIAKLRELSGSVGTEGKDVHVAGVLKKAMEADINSPFVNFKGPEAVKIQKALTKANWFFNEGMKKFESTQGKKMGKVDKHIFSSSFDQAGAKHADEIFSDVFNAKSAEGLREIRKLVGPKHYNQGLRSHLEKVMENARTVSKDGATSIDFNKFEKAVGLGDQGSKDVLEEMLKGTDVSVKNWEEFVKIGKAANSFTIPNASVFLQRRVTLGGIGSLLAVAAVGQSSAWAGILSLYVMRKGAKLLSDPAALRSLTTALDTSAAKTARRNAGMRLVREMAIDDKASDLPDLTTEDIEAEEQSNLPSSVKSLQSSMAAGSSSLQSRIQAAIQ